MNRFRMLLNILVVYRINGLNELNNLNHIHFGWDL